MNFSLSFSFKKCVWNCRQEIVVRKFSRPECLTNREQCAIRVLDTSVLVTNSQLDAYIGYAKNEMGLQCGAVITRSFFFTNIHKRHLMARPLGGGMGCCLWVQHLIDILPQCLQLFVQYLIILDRVITALNWTVRSSIQYYVAALSAW